MSARSNNKPRRAAVKAPPSATHWSCSRIEYGKGTNAEGRHYSSSRQKRCKAPDAAPDGTVAEVWPVAEFSTRRVLEMWGPGRYRVDWYGADDAKISGDVFQVDQPAREKMPDVAQVQQGAAPAVSAFGASMPQTAQEWQFYMAERERQDRAERKAEAREEENRREAQFERQRQADREHTQNLIAALTANRGAGGPAPVVDVDLLRREIAVTLREQVGTVRADLAAQLGAQLSQLRGNGRGGDDDNDDPTDLGDGVERIGLRVLGEIEDAAPDIVEAALPGIIALLQGRGWKPSPAVQQALEALRARTNGAAS